jgi:hypothetical protein
VVMTSMYFEDHPTDPNKVIIRKPRHDDDDIQDYVRPWRGLTDEEVDKAWRSVDHTIPYAQFRIDVAKAIEAKLKDKNT